MFGAFERRVALRYLRARKGERFVSIIAIFSLIGIALGVATLIIVMSVMNGFRQELLAQILGLNGDVSLYGAGHPIPDYQAALGKLGKIQGVRAAIPIVQGEVLLTGPRGGAIGGVARGIPLSGLEALPTVSTHVIDGSLKDFKGNNAAIGAGIASQLGIAAGGTITLVLPQGSATIIGTIPRIESFHVAAVFQTGMAQYDSSFLFLPIQAAQTLFQVPHGAATEIQLFVQNPDQDQPVIRAAASAFADTPVTVQDWRNSNNAFFTAVNVERNVMFLILTLIIIVAAFNVISSMIMMVKDKTGDIAILRTMGASSGAILRIFLMVGASVGILGTIIGFVLGTIFTLNIEKIRMAIQSVTGTQLFNPTVYYLESLPAQLQWPEVIEVLILALVLSLLATLYPSWRAARTDPIEALRHE